MGNICSRSQNDYDYPEAPIKRIDSEKQNAKKMKRIQEHGGINLMALCVDDSNIDFGSQENQKSNNNMKFTLEQNHDNDFHFKVTEHQFQTKNSNQRKLRLNYHQYMDNDQDSRNRRTPKLGPSQGDVQEFIPVITYVYRDENGNEQENLKHEIKDEQPSNYQQNTVVNDNWLDDSSMQIVDTSKILRELTPMQSYLEYSKTVTPKHNLEGRLSLNNLHKPTQSSSQGRKSMLYQTQQLIQEESDSLDEQNEPLRLRTHELEQYRENQQQPHQDEELVFRDDENEINISYLDSNNHQDIDYQAIKKQIEEKRVKDEFKFTGYLASEIQNQIYYERNIVNFKQTLFESQLNKVNPLQTSQISRWVKLSRHDLLCYADEWKAKTFSKPLIDISISDIISVEKALAKNLKLLNKKNEKIFPIIIHSQAKGSGSFMEENKRSRNGDVQTQQEMNQLGASFLFSNNSVRQTPEELGLPFLMSEHSLISFDLDEKEIIGITSADNTLNYNQQATQTTHIFIASSEELQKKWYCLIKWVVDLYNQN